jgi:SAM-dependent methyltransferase
MASSAPRAGAGVAYWERRAALLGADAVLNVDHEPGSLEAVSDAHRDLLLPLLAQSLEPDGDALVLDLGCGSGRLTGALADLAGRAVGADPTAALLELAPEHPGVEYRRIEDDGVLPLADGEADVVFTCLVLGGIVGDDALAATAAEVDRVLAPGGLVLLCESVSQRPFAGHWRFRTARAYRDAFAFAALAEVAAFDDAGDAVSVLAGRRPA